jgi:phosphatidylserine/phosphatidylglycerophosphate/cardiolipin synthase-like enzyme
VRRIWIDTYTSDADNSDPVEILDWYLIPEDTYELKFRSQPQTGRTIYIQYMGVHPDIWTSTDTLKTSVDRNRIVAEAVYRLLKEKIRKDRDTSDIAIQILNDAREDVMEARKKHRITDPGTPFKPILTRSGVNRRAKYGPWLTE